MSKKAAAFLIVISMLLTLTPLISYEADSYTFSGGSGTQGDPYIIKSVWDLQNISYEEDACYVLGNDINASITRTWNGGAGFEPIAPFTGNIQGNFFNISDLYINRSESNNTGFIGLMEYPGSLDKINLVGIEVHGSYYVGGMVGNFGKNSRITNSTVQGIVNGNDSVGGFIGGAEWIYDWGSIDNSSSYVDVQGYRKVGGFAGLMCADVINCFSTGNVSGYDMVGGFVGWKFFGSVINCYSTGPVTSVWSQFNNGFCGFVNAGKVFSCFYDINTSGKNNDPVAKGKKTAEMMIRSTFQEAGWDFNTTWLIAEGRSYPFFRRDDRTPPLADAGPDLIVYEDKPVLFDGGFSSDNIGIREYRWIVNDTQPVVLNGESISHIFEDVGFYRVILNVMDGGGHWAGDSLNVTVLDATRPICDGGPDVSVDEDHILFLDGGQSRDNVNISYYNWTIHDKVDVSLQGREVDYVFRDPGVFRVDLNVTDESCFWDNDTVYVRVLDITSPIAEAGPDLILDKGETAYFNGSESSDNDRIASFTWTFKDVESKSLDGRMPLYTFYTSGFYIVTLIVKDRAGNSAADKMNVTILEDCFPIARAGPDMVVDEGAVVSFNANESEDDHGVVDYSWTFTDRDTVVLCGIVASYQFSDPGAFKVNLRVTDREGKLGEDSLLVIVNDITPPEANAGSDRSIAEGKLVEFMGEGSFDNVGIGKFVWSFVDGKPVEMEGQNPAYIFQDPGSFRVTLRVFDAAGNSDEDSVLITVIDITAPDADAGPNQIVPVGSRVFFNGSLSTDNGRIERFVWTFMNGGSTVTLEGMETSFQFNKGGTYEINLKVIDGGGNMGSDNLHVYVIDAGRITGFVFDEKGNPVIGATFEVDSAGRIYTTLTTMNGSFSLDLPMGEITWKLTKKGYETRSGKAVIEPMKTTLIDPDPMTKEGVDRSGPSTFWIASIIVLAILGIAIFVIAWRRVDPNRFEE